MRSKTFNGLEEFRGIVPELATASNHNVFIDVGSGYELSAGEPLDPVQVEKQAIWNSRDDELAYIGSDNYEITQHSDVLQLIDDAVGQTVGEIDIGYVRDYGERIDGMVTLNGHNVDVGELVGDGYVPPEGELLDDRTQDVESAFQDDSGWARDILGVGVRFNNSFDASERIRLETMGYRYICQNWCVWGKETIGEFEQLHINELEAEDVEELITDVVDKKSEVESIIVDSNSDKLKWEWISPLLEEVGFGTYYQRSIIKKLRSYDGVSEDEDIRRWDLYNAVTDHLDHATVQDVNPNVYDRHQNKAIKVLTEDVKSPDEEVPIPVVMGEE